MRPWAKLRTMRLASSSKKDRSTDTRAYPRPGARRLKDRRRQASLEAVAAPFLVVRAARQPVAHGEGRRLGAVGKAQLSQDVAHVVAHRLLAQVDDGGDLLVGLSFRDEAQEPALLIRQGLGQV